MKYVVSKHEEKDLYKVYEVRSASLEERIAELDNNGVMYTALSPNWVSEEEAWDEFDYLWHKHYEKAN